jgi:CII-binding regulator of phage lambda lysogenization HflD
VYWSTFTTPAGLSPSKAQLFTSTLDLEEATLHLAGKGGDALAKLICTLMDLKRNYAHNAALVENLETSIQVLQRKREQETQQAVE